MDDLYARNNLEEIVFDIWTQGMGYEELDQKQHLIRDCLGKMTDVELMKEMQEYGNNF